MHDKVKAFLIAAIVVLAVLLVAEPLLKVDIVPDDTAKLFWSSLVPVIIGAVVAWFTREGHGPTK
jgi:hypothetical protein